ncbi:GNAT family N-acetyltransferase [Ectothiorhodospira lacustris]|uniref:GNAT family N-acetyltransferase n=1 Tax=Ectothiorhodospira lacustris TaxID=2899127 RepID=UPI001EE951B7|nr:GNAT family N-acetyltransferase [Ectothiorhodospira lacustris]MCG5523079.1 GNAT family N-acetyltransferase [Ectothiorhodospira lacustris]
MEIVPLADKKEFITELAKLHHSEWRHLNPSLTLEGRTEAISKAARREGIPSIFVAVSGSQLIGSAALVQNDMDTKPDLSPWLAAVYVKESFRHHGIATGLIARCEAEAVRSSADTWYLYTEFASKIYEKLGWRHLERCKYKGVAVDVMCKQITS